MDPARDTLMKQEANLPTTQMGLDATNKVEGEETQREWGRPIKKDPAVVAKIDEIWDQLGIE